MDDFDATWGAIAYWFATSKSPEAQKAREDYAKAMDKMLNAECPLLQKFLE